MSRCGDAGLRGPARQLCAYAGYVLLGVWVFGGSLFFFLRFSFEFLHYLSPGGPIARFLDGQL